MPVGTGGRGGPPPDDSDPRTRMLWEAREKGVGFADLDRIAVDRSAFEDIPFVLQCEYGVLPVKKDGQTLYVAMGEISSETCAALGAFTGLRIVPVLALPDRIPEVRRRAFEGEEP